MNFDDIKYIICFLVVILYLIFSMRRENFKLDKLHSIIIILIFAVYLIIKSEFVFIGVLFSLIINAIKNDMPIKSIYMRKLIIFGHLALIIFSLYLLVEKIIGKM